YPNSIDNISEYINKNIIVKDFYNENTIIYNSNNNYNETIYLGYIIGPLYYSIGQFQQLNEYCKYVNRIFKNISHTNLISSHYDNTINSKSQENSDIENIRKFNNFIKSILINLTVNQGDSVLDLGSGKGGDLNKWCNRKIKLLTSVDISKKSLKEAENRFNNMHWCKFNTEWIYADPYTTLL